MGSTSFEHLLMFDNILYDTYKGACVARGLLEDDTEWHACMEEAVLFKSPRALRDLFLAILENCAPTDPKALFDQFNCDMMEDFTYKYKQQNLTEEQCITYATNDLLCYFDDSFQAKRKTNQDYSLPPADHDLNSDTNSDDIPSEEYDDSAEDFYNAHCGMCNEDQLAALNEITENLDIGEGGFKFIDAPGGTGKTFLLNLILSMVRKDENIAIGTATTGIASTLLRLGTTAHSRFKFPLDIKPDSVCNITPNSKRGKLIAEAKVIIIDEIGQFQNLHIEALDRLLQDLTKVEKPFGGILLIIAGDFRQILPVIKHGRRSNVVQSIVKKSEL